MAKNAHEPFLPFNFPPKSSPSLLIHLGGHKTGSTTLQQTLSASHDRLRQVGVIYPFSGREHWQHRALFSSLRQSDGELAFDIAKAILKEADGAHILLSSEWAQFLSDVQIELAGNVFCNVFKGYRIFLLYYLRRQDRLFDSLYNQEVKFGSYSGDFASFYERYEYMGRYFRHLEKWKQAIKDSSLEVRAYGRDNDSKFDTIDNFAAFLPASALVRTISVDANHSIEKRLFDFKLRMNKFLNKGDEGILRLLAAVISDVSRDITPQSCFVTTDFERDCIMANFRNENMMISEAYDLGTEWYQSKIFDSPNFPPTDRDQDIFASLLVHMTRYIEHRFNGGGSS